MGSPLLISDCRSTALVDERGDVTWLCAPRMDQAAVFAALLDPDRGGALELLMAGGAETVGHRHVEGALVAETTRRAPDGGVVRVTDALLMDPRGPGADADPGGLVRRIEVLEGVADVGVRVGLRFGYGLNPPRWVRDGRATRAVGPGPAIELQSEIPVRPSGPDVAGAVRLEAGSVRMVALRWQDPKGLGTDLRAMLDGTIAWWRAWGAPAGGDPAALELMGLMHAPTGGLMRSATTSLGATAEDGRVVVLDDVARAESAFRARGLGAAADRLAAWRARAGDGPPVRALSGGPVPEEQTLDHLGRRVAVGAPAGDARGNLPYAPDLIGRL
jgi:hypothetical protein